jgi:3-oxoacyl-[acyl-carrier protein] reductase
VDLTGKVAFVTGGSGDIGGAIARRLADAGVEVAVSYVGDAERAGATVDAVQKIGRRSLAVRLDQRDSNSVDACVKEVIAGLAGSTSSSTMPHGTSAFRSAT